jgi:hypothetical protein
MASRPTLAAFKRHVSIHRAPPRAVSAPLQGLWWAKKGDWEKAHRIVMAEHSREAAWVHAHLHRVEGDAGNADYWYRQARRKPACGPHEAEWQAMVAALLPVAR